MKKIKSRINNIPQPIIIFFIALTLIQFYKNTENIINIKSKDGFQKATAISNNKNCRIKKNSICLDFVIKDLKIGKSILFLGNSQNGSINNFQKGDFDFVNSLNKKSVLTLKEYSINSLWIPNASLLEFAEINKGLLKCKIEPEVLIIPAFLDDTREQTIREHINDFEKQVCIDKFNDKNESKFISSNVKVLDNSIKKNLPIFSDLQSINTKFRTDLYKLRNFIFRIQPTSIRKIKKASYSSNINALKEILKTRNKKNLHNIVYIPPLLFSNKPNMIPYSHDEYENFKNSIKEICISYKCRFFNLENSVPNKYWGTKSSTTFLNKNEEIDFMHFNGDGHKKFSEVFSSIIKNYIEKT
tara:strand:- start:49 stop:1119 length:1071 start_codon:yes stop_codon:yes gene_type:complete